MSGYIETTTKAISTIVLEVALPAWLARINKLVTNPLLRPVAARAPYFGIVVHRGRVSGRVYRTPVNVFQRGEEVIFALTYGPDRDWVRNVMQQGPFTLIHRGRSTELIEPRLQDTIEAPALIPAVVRGILRRLSVHTFLLARRAHG
jgi:deazaflavin-dependent oxidoreductase (nitroreductase family)